MLIETRLTFFLYFLDRILPRFLVKLPYSFGAFFIRKRIGKLAKADIWFRNSFIKGNLVFGVSDLDISIMIDTFDQALIDNLKIELQKLKSAIPFMGEVNFFIKDQIKELSPSFNLFEKKRDPKLDLVLSDYSPFGEKIEKAVFLIRMLHSDRKNLSINPKMRQKKWRNHFSELNLYAPKIIEKNIIIQTIVELLDLKEDKQNAMEALSFLFSKDYDPDKIFLIETPGFWKFIFPNQYFWDDVEKEKMGSIFDSPLKFVCLRQIDWEIWGLNSQIPFIANRNDGIKIHIQRLERLAKSLSKDYDLSDRVEMLINNSQK